MYTLLKIKYTLLFAFLLFTSVACTQNAVFNIKYSEQLAVFIFLQNISENAGENTFKTIFQKSKYYNPTHKSIISKFDTLRIDYSYSFESYPFGSKMPMQTRDLLKKNLIETTNIEEFKRRSIGLLPNQTLNDLAEIVTIFTPIYNELIYTPNKKQFETQMSKIISYANEHGVNDYFEKGKQFYHSSWQHSIPFEIAFYPLPNSKGFTAQAFYNHFISAIQTDLTSYKDLFSVMLHEIFHILYDEQSLETKTQIHQYFTENKSKYSNYAYLIMNEVLATALGNGYVYEKLTGNLDSAEWYHHKYINLMAKKIYPLILEYLIQKKHIDERFVNLYIKAYEINFPNWINELENIMSYRYILSENKEDFKIINTLFWHRSNEFYNNEITENTIHAMYQTPLTKLIIVSNNNADKLTLIKKNISELKNQKFNADKEFVYKILLKNNSQLIIINQTKSTTKALIESIK